MIAQVVSYVGYKSIIDFVHEEGTKVVGFLFSNLNNLFIYRVDGLWFARQLEEQPLSYHGVVEVPTHIVDIAQELVQQQHKLTQQSKFLDQILDRTQPL